MAFRVPKCLHLGGKSGVESEQISSEAIIFRSVWHLDSNGRVFQQTLDKPLEGDKATLSYAG